MVPRSLALTFVGTCSPLIRPPRQCPGRPLRSPSTSPGERVALSVTRGAGCGCPVVPGTEPLQGIHGVAGVQRGLGVSREGVGSFPSGPTSSCLRPSQTPMEVVPVFPNRAARVWGDRLEGAGQAASPWEPLAQLKGALGGGGALPLGWASISSQGSRGGGQEQRVLPPVPSAAFGSQDASCEALTRSAPVRPPGQSWLRRRARRGAP